jgi:superfamily I DNA and/or RNA helicase
VEEVARLLADGRYVDCDGVSRRLEPKDILVVAPYNMQVRCLLEHLPAGVEAGTVDKFQGREAPIVFFSLATSSGENVPRDLTFLFSRNRLNVAVSRAKCLAVLVASPRLLEVACRTVEQMRLVNGWCRFVELAGDVADIAKSDRNGRVASIS